MQNEKFNFGKLFLIGFGFFGVSVLWSLYNTYVPILLEQKFALDAAAIGFFMSLDNIAALFIQPPVGAWSDRLRTRLGRRLPFILVGAPIAAVAFGLVPLANTLPLFVACTVTTILAMAFWRTPVVALMPDVTPSRLRSQANGIINFMGGLGLVLGTSIGATLVKQNQAYPFWFGSLLVVLAAALVLIFVREPKVYENNPNAEKPNMWKSLKELFTSKHGDAIRIFLAIFFWFIAYNAIEAFLSLYGINHLGLDKSGAGKLITSVGFSFLLFSIPAGFIGAKLGRRKTIGMGLLIMILVLLSVYFLPKELLIQAHGKLPILGDFMNLTILLLLAGIGWACININSLPVVVDLTDPIHIGTYTGLYYLFSTLAAIAGPNINGWIVKLTGNNYASIFIIGPLFMAAAFAMVFGMHEGNGKTRTAAEGGADPEQN
ncbi:MAG: SLC45 family MFS transporter [Chloroflexi bacterium]|jgi:MFS family permease|nr:SLC45 family MFS transporter [Chloroflexota bacterium]HOT52961.1 MFS transporter [Anaerolineaceae bacterium]